MGGLEWVKKIWQGWEACWQQSQGKTDDPQQEKGGDTWREASVASASLEKRAVKELARGLLRRALRAAVLNTTGGEKGNRKRRTRGGALNQAEEER